MIFEIGCEIARLQDIVKTLQVFMALMQCSWRN